MDTNGIAITDSMGIMKGAKESRGIKQTELAKRVGMKQQTLSESIARRRISLGAFAKILNALDYDVVIVDRETGEAKWKVEVEEEL